MWIDVNGVIQLYIVIYSKPDLSVAYCKSCQRRQTTLDQSTLSTYMHRRWLTNY